MDKANVVYLCSRILFSNEGSEVPMNAVVRKKFDTFVLSSGSSWSPKTIVWFHLYEMSRIGKSVETGSRFVVSG